MQLYNSWNSFNFFFIFVLLNNSFPVTLGLVWNILLILFTVFIGNYYDEDYRHEYTLIVVVGVPSMINISSGTSSYTLKLQVGWKYS